MLCPVVNYILNTHITRSAFSIQVSVYISFVCFRFVFTGTEIRANPLRYCSLCFSTLEGAVATFSLARFLFHGFYIFWRTEQASNCRWRLDIIWIDLNFIIDSFFIRGFSTKLEKSSGCRCCVRLPKIDRQFVLDI